MHHLNVEIKARCDDLAHVRAQLRAMGAHFQGEDHQVDTYFVLPDGRLKLREGTLETALIFYRRPDQTGPKVSDVRRYEPAQPAALKPVLAAALGVDVVVDKQREICFIGSSIKIHLDRVSELGTFVEIEAVGADATADAEALGEQCRRVMEQLRIDEEALVESSYADLQRRQ